MNDFWQALAAVLIALAGVLTAVGQRVRSQRVQAKLTAENALERERKESAERERKASQEALEFRERLRQEAIAERGTLISQLSDIAAALRENTNVMERSSQITERSVDLTERILDGLISRDPHQRTRSGDAASRPAPRRSAGGGEGGDQRRSRGRKANSDSP